MEREDQLNTSITEMVNKKVGCPRECSYLGQVKGVWDLPLVIVHIPRDKSVHTLIMLCPKLSSIHGLLNHSIFVNTSGFK